MRNFNFKSCSLIFEILSLLLFHVHPTLSACTTHKGCRMGSECQIKSDTNSNATQKTGFKYILLRNKCSLGICYDGPIGQKDLCQHFVENYTFVESQPLSIITECLCSLSPQNKIDTYREWKLFSIIITTLPLGWPIRQGQGQQFDLAWGTRALLTYLRWTIDDSSHRSYGH